MSIILRSLKIGAFFLIVLPAAIGFVIALIFSKEGILLTLWLKSAGISNIAIFIGILCCKLQEI